MNRVPQETAVDEIYQQVVEHLSVADRLVLVQRILRELEQNLRIDDSDAWTEEDLRDVTAHSVRNSEQWLEDMP